MGSNKTFGFVTSGNRYYACTDEAHARQIAGLVPGATLVREEWYSRPTTPRDAEFELTDTCSRMRLVDA